MRDSRESIIKETGTKGKGKDAVKTISLFRDDVLSRRASELYFLERQLIAEGVGTDYDQKPWGLMYGAMEKSLGVSPKNFQMVYPFTSWNWATQNVGFISSAQYDFCSTVPQWSAVGNYSSSGDRFNFAYQQFLNIILPATSDPQLRAEITEAEEALTRATNEYTSTYNQARIIYQGDSSVVDNVPTFEEWLASPAGAGWNTQLAAKKVNMDQAQKNYNAVVAKANTPGLEDALEQFKNESFYSKLNDPNLSNFPAVPNWSIPISASKWVDNIKAGKGPAGGTIGFNNRDQSYDYSKTWAGGSLSIRKFFWSVKVGGKWERVTQFETDNELNVSIEMEAMDVISIQPSDWYNGPFVKSMAKGPFTRGYSPYGEDGTQAVFGEKGFINLLKTGMYVCYKPTFNITVSKSTFDSFYQKFEASTGIRIGPFTFEAKGGSTQSGWNASKEGSSFTGTSTSEEALIFGITIAELPNSSTNE